MLRHKLRRTFWRYKAQFISMIIMIALGVGIFVGFNMEWISIERNTGRFFEETGFADYRIAAIGARDYPLVQGCVLVFSIFVMVVNLIVDLTYKVIDPRVEID